MEAPKAGTGKTEAFRIEGFAGLVSRAAGLVDPAAAARRACDPANAVETVHWGRNYLYSIELAGRDGPVAAVVKLFRNQGWRRRLERRLKGSKATRSWSMALAMRAYGVRTPEPLMLLESDRIDGPSIFVSRQICGSIEARFLFRALKASTVAEDSPAVDSEALGRAVARTARGLHDAGFWHRDFSIGNLLVTCRDDGEIRIDLVDLNRARHKERLTVSERTRDLCRLGFYDPFLDGIFLDSYWEGRHSGRVWKRWLYRLYRSAYLFRVEGKKKLRAFSSGVGGKLFLRQPYAHIPPPPEGANKRDKAVWDALSDQPHQHAGRSERLQVRIGDLGSHLRAVSVAVAATPRIRRRYKELRRGLWSEPTRWPGVGVGIGPASGDADELLGAIDELGVERVLLRFHPWEESHAEGVELARRLAGRGIDLVFALPQVRSLVNDPPRWANAVRTLGEALIAYGRSFQIGQAINRSKWGLWNYSEYVALLTVAKRELEALGDIEILGPGVIDFEPHALAAALNYAGEPRLDVVSSLLYVDRRGAPENEQLGFDALGKAAVLRAVGEAGRTGSERYWITEFNWPLREGPHSPAGRSVSVDEDRQASYLVRYLVPILASGLAERAYWWQLAARGYGLLDPQPDGLRRRPAFHAMATLERQLSKATANGPVDLGPGTRAYRFNHPERGDGLVAWALQGPVEAMLPRPAGRVVARDGGEVDSVGERVTLGPAPGYVWFG